MRILRITPRPRMRARVSYVAPYDHLPDKLEERPLMQIHRRRKIGVYIKSRIRT